MGKGTKARKAAKQQSGSSKRHSTRVRKTTHFYKPRTLKLARNPRYVRKALGRDGPVMDKHRVVRYPLTTEASMKKIEEHNTLGFIVDRLANKRQIRAAIKGLYNIDMVKINTLIRPDGLKKAYVRLTKDYDALDVANQIGII